jgi:UDP-glucose 4-epimerase
VNHEKKSYFLIFVWGNIFKVTESKNIYFLKDFDFIKFGNDFNTADGTGIRDFIHIQDLSDAHLRSLENINSVKDHLFLNIGTGKGYSVLQLVETFKKVTSQNIPYIFTDRRDGDIDICYANADKANKFLDWSTSKDLNDMCRDAWRWQLNNPTGYN